MAWKHILSRILLIKLDGKCDVTWNYSSPSLENMCNAIISVYQGYCSDIVFALRSAHNKAMSETSGSCFN